MNPDWQAAPLTPSWVIKGNPVAMVCPIANDGRVSTGYWQCTPGEFWWHYDVDETIVFLSGAAIVNGGFMGPGSTRSFTRGTVATWHVLEAVTKMYVIERRKSLPRRILGRLKRLLRG